jgi:lyso-ornithine lipid O-acyltransferase
LFLVAFLPFQLFFRNSLFLPRLFHRFAAFILNIKIEKKGEMCQVLIVSNHSSWLDILVYGSLKELRFVAKDDVAGWFGFGLLAKLQNTIFVNRDNPRNIASERNKISEAIHHKPVVLFAEGTTSDGTTVLPFKSSLIIAPAQAAMICYDNPQATAWYADMELLPHLKAVFALKEIRVKVVFLETFEEGNRKEIALKCEKAVLNQFNLSHKVKSV